MAKGITRIVRKLPKIPRGKARKVAKAVQEYVVNQAPEDTGDLKRSIRVTAYKGNLNIVASVPYARYVDWEPDDFTHVIEKAAEE